MSLPFAALLLAGGKSRRMGEDKARLRWQGHPLWWHQCQTLGQLRPRRLLVASRVEQNLDAELPAGNLSLDQAPSLEWLMDPEGDDCGPMGAMERGLLSAQSPLLVLAVDMPQMTASYLQEHLLPPQAEEPRARFFELSGRFEPLAVFYTPSLLPLMRRLLEKREFSLQRLLGEAVSLDLAERLPVPPEQHGFFANLNTPLDWKKNSRPPEKAAD